MPVGIRNRTHDYIPDPSVDHCRRQWGRYVAYILIIASAPYEGRVPGESLWAAYKVSDSLVL